MGSGRGVADDRCGLSSRLANRVFEVAFEGGMDERLGYGKHDPAGRDGGNSRNGKRAETASHLELLWTTRFSLTARR